MTLFWKNGFKTTTTRQLEGALGLNQSSIYHHFGSKQKLLLRAIQEYEKQATEKLLRPLEQSSGGLIDIEQFFRNLVRWISDDGRRGCLLTNMMVEEGETSEIIGERTKKYRHKVKQAFKHCLEVAAAQGQLLSPNPQQQSELLLGLTLGINIAARGGASHRELNALLRAISSQLQSWSVDQKSTT